MRRLIAAVLLVITIAFVPAMASADSGQNKKNDDFLLKADGSIHVAADQTVGTVVAISSDVQVDGTVKDLVVIDADVTITGRVDGRLTMIDGRVTLAPTAQVKDIHRIGGSITREDGAVVTGRIKERNDLVFDGFGWAFAAVAWAAVTFAVLSAGVAFSLVAGRQLRHTAAYLSEHPAESIATGIILWIAAPLIVIALLISIIGIPVGLAVLALLPAVALLGYAVAGYRLGAWIIAKVSASNPERTVLPTLTGLVALQVLVLVPVLGAAVAVMAATWGVGALALTVSRSIGRQRPMASGAAA